LTAIADRHFVGVEPLAPEDVLRAQLYRMLANALSDAPTFDDLKRYARLTGDGTPLGIAFAAFARVAVVTTPESAKREYQDLFIGVGRGELVPYGSYYLTGFLQEKPLARLRQDLAAHGIRRSEATSDPEDHVAAVLGAFAGLIDGAFGAPLGLDDQKAFYERHIQSWMPVFFRDLEAANASVFYASLGSIGRAFLDIEDGAFEMIQTASRQRSN
jgi:TorA maturation chaperone TorD